MSSPRSGSKETLKGKGGDGGGGGGEGGVEVEADGCESICCVPVMLSVLLHACVALLYEPVCLDAFLECALGEKKKISTSPTWGFPYSYSAPFICSAES